MRNYLNLGRTKKIYADTLLREARKVKRSTPAGGNQAEKEFSELLRDVLEIHPSNSWPNLEANYAS